MIKGRSGRVVLFGLSRLNIERLQAGMPISFEGSEVNLPDVRFVIIAGETEPEMAQMLRDGGMVGPETKVTDRYKGKGKH